MKKFILLSVTAVATLLMVACGKDGSGGNAGTGIPSCGVGLVYDVNTNTCVTVNGGNVVNQYVRFYDYTMYPMSYQRGSMTVTHNAGFKAFLSEAMGVCDRNIAGWSTGVYKCDNWVSGSFTMQVGVGSNLVPELRFEAYPTPSFFNFNMGIYGNTAVLNPLVLNQTNTFSLRNNSKGFEIRAQGSMLTASGLRLIQVIVENGTLADTQVTYGLYYPYNGTAVKIASGTMRRY